MSAAAIGQGVIAFLLVGFVYFLGFGHGHDCGHAQGYLDAKLDTETDEHAQGIPK